MLDVRQIKNLAAHWRFGSSCLEQKAHTRRFLLICINPG
jgi:hypothetical protein